jgi:hypothetical protein
MVDAIALPPEDIREGLRLMREMDAAHRALHAAQENYQQYIGHLAALYTVPGGWGLKDWMIGFEPVTEAQNG